MSKAVEIKNLTKKYGKRVIFSNLNICVEDGEIVALVGASGCGKSTLLNIIGLLERYDAGDIKICGKKNPEIESSAATMLRRNTINYLFQSFALIGDMTVVQNLLIAMKFLNITQKEKERRIDKVLEQVNLLPLKEERKKMAKRSKRFKEEMVHTLSGGEQQRVALARTILKPGNIVLADEPTGALDTESAMNAFSLIKDLCKQYGKTVIMVTHSLELAQKTDRVIDLTKCKMEK